MQISKNKNKIIWTSILVILLLAIIIPGPRELLFEGHVFGAIDSAATEYVDSGLKRATTAFALARTFNAIVSVFRESNLQLEPGGLGVSVALGAALDPANDLVERFSWVMLVSMTSLGIQKLLIEIVPFLSIQIILLLSLLSLLGGLWLSDSLPVNLLRTGKILLFVAILLRFAVPTMAYVNDQVYVAFLEQKQNQSVEAIGQTVENLEAQQLTSIVDGSTPISQQDEGEENQGLWKRTKMAVSNLADQSRNILDIRTKLEEIKTASGELIDHIVDLIVIFVISTIFLPILFLWAILKLGRLIIGGGFGVSGEEWIAEKVGTKDL